MALTNLTKGLTVDSEGGSATINLAQGLAKAWSLLDGTGTIALSDSFNIGSTTDHGTGDYTLTVSNAFSSANFSCTANGRQDESPAAVTIKFFIFLLQFSYIYKTTTFKIFL